MKALFFACSELSALDIQTQKLSLFNLFEEIYSVNYPVFVQSISLVITLEKEKGDEDKAKILFRLAVGDDEVFRIDSEIIFGQRKRARALTVVNGILIPRPGILSVSAHHKKQMLADWSIFLNQIENPQPVLAIPPAHEPLKRRKRNVI